MATVEVQEGRVNEEAGDHDMRYVTISTYWFLEATRCSHLSPLSSSKLHDKTVNEVRDLLKSGAQFVTEITLEDMRYTVLNVPEEPMVEAIKSAKP